MWFNPHAFLQKQGATLSKVTKVSKVPALTPPDPSTLDSLDTLDTLDPRPTGSGGAPDGANAQPSSEANVTTTLITWPGKTVRPFLVAIDGSTACPSCGQTGRIPHHLSLIFWTFWSHTRLAALVGAMRPDERLAWLAKGLVQVEGAGGQRRELHDVGGHWNEAPKAAGDESR